MHTAAEERLALRADLRQAVDRGEFELYFQPTVAVDTGVLRGFEALIRWQHPTRGLIGPGEFIGHAEDTGLIVPIGKWVLDAACRELAGLQAVDPLLTMAVNLSTRQLEEADVIDHVRAALEDSGVDPATLTIELTESLLIGEAPEIADRLHALKALGVKLAIDDFGTGFSSLGYLRRLPIDILKIDRSFVDGIDCLDAHTALVTMILSLSEMLGLVTVAEGVETPAQLEALRKLHCPIAQGYLFAKPLPEAAALAYLERSLAVTARA